MYDLLKGLRIIEATSFVASPSAGMYLAQLGAEVIRVDHVKGCLLYTSPSPRDGLLSRMPSSA